MESVESRSDTRSMAIAATAARVFATLRDPVRLARWWGPAGFHSTIHELAFAPQAIWRLTLHGPDGRDFPNVYRLLRLDVDRSVEIEHLSDGHQFILSIALCEDGTRTVVDWRQTFDSAAHFAPLAGFLAEANAQVLERLATEVLAVGAAA